NCSPNNLIRLSQSPAAGTLVGLGTTTITVTATDQASNTWTEVTSVGAPSTRYLHTAVWTGSEMIVWGGIESSSLNTGGRYNPANETWTPISTTGAPSARYYHTAVWTGSEMIVWGGNDGSYLNDGGRYNPATDT